MFCTVLYVEEAADTVLTVFGVDCLVEQLERASLGRHQRATDLKPQRSDCDLDVVTSATARGSRAKA